MSAAIDNGFMHINLGVTIEPLLAQHGDKCGEARGSQTRIKDGLDADDSRIGTTPCGESGVGLDVPNRGTCYDHEEAVAQLCVIRLEVALSVDNESGCNCGEQTGLYPQKNQINTVTDLGAKKYSRRSRWYSSLHRISSQSRGRTCRLHAGTYGRMRHGRSRKFQSGSEKEMEMP